MSQYFDEKNFLTAIRRHLELQMHEAAEEVVKEAVRKYEAHVRKEVATAVLSLLETSYNAYRDGRDLVIRVQMATPGDSLP
jgi:uncharacterized protein (DUF2267 family)